MLALVCVLATSGCFGGNGSIHLLAEEHLLLATVESPVEVSVAAVHGREPAPSIIAAIRRNLESLNGPGTVRISPTSFLPIEGDQDRVWDATSLSLLDPPNANVRSLRFYFLDGTYRNPAGDEVLGTSFETAAYVFPDRMDDLKVDDMRHDNLLFDRTPFIQAITLHEMGHSIGLVGNPAPMLVARHPPPDQDPCQCHSDRQDSVMSYAVHSLQDDVQDTLTGQTSFPTGYDQFDWQDLRAHQATLRERSAS